MKSMKRSAAMFARAAGTNVVSNVKSKDNVCKDKCFKEKNLCRVCSTRQSKTKRSKLELCFNRFWCVVGETCKTGKVYSRTGYCKNCRQNIGYTVEIVKVCRRGLALYSSYADLRNRVETSQNSKNEVLIPINEDMRTVPRELCISCDFYWQ